jgi:8-oxo-dGTP diphosphatase
MIRTAEVKTKKKGCDVNTRPRMVLVGRAVIIDKGKFLVVQRAKNDRSEPNLYEFPGGKVDPGETFAEALEEEVFEETHLVVSQSRQIAYVAERMNTSGPYAGLLYRVEVVLCTKSAGRLRLSPEHQNASWCTLNNVERLPLTRLTSKALAELEPQILREMKLR